jgi:DNA-binding MarR family transcriptional regulator
MNQDILNKVLENFITVVPQFYKKFEKVKSEIVHKRKIAKSHMEILSIIKREKSIAMSEIGKRMYISKPNVTTLISRLISLNLVKRITEENDRRIIFIQLTEEGEKFILDCRSEYFNIVKEIISRYNDEELILLQTILDSANKLLNKFETGKEKINE